MTKEIWCLSFVYL